MSEWERRVGVGFLFLYYSNYWRTRSTSQVKLSPVKNLSLHCKKSLYHRHKTLEPYNLSHITHTNHCLENLFTLIVVEDRKREVEERKTGKAYFWNLKRYMYTCVCLCVYVCVYIFLFFIWKTPQKKKDKDEKCCVGSWFL